MHPPLPPADSPAPSDRATPLPLHAQLFLVAIDPETGRLGGRHRRRFRLALARACERSGPGAGTGARRAAIAELRAAGFVERSWRPGHHPIVTGSSAGATLQRLRTQMKTEEWARPADVTLLILLLWTQVFHYRLKKADYKTALKRARKYSKAPPVQFPVLTEQADFGAELAQMHAAITDLVGEMEIDAGSYTDGSSGFGDLHTY